jgi:hypothetical protein
MKRRIFTSIKSARHAGLQAVTGRALQFKIEATVIWNKDRSADIGWQVSLWSPVGNLKGWVRG